jgi:hypothetical protein
VSPELWSDVCQVGTRTQGPQRREGRKQAEPEMANGRWHMTERFCAESGTRWNASLPGEGVAWLTPRALVHAGEAGFKGIDAGGLPFKGG